MGTFDQIFQDCHHSLLLYSLKFVENEDDAHDIVQEICGCLEKGKVWIGAYSFKVLFVFATQGIVKLNKRQLLIRFITSITYSELSFPWKRESYQIFWLFILRFRIKFCKFLRNDVVVALFRICKKSIMKLVLESSFWFFFIGFCTSKRKNKVDTWLHFTM